MKKLCLVSLGCNKNLVDSEVMLGKLKGYTLVDEVEDSDLIIVNTCGFIASAKQESIEKILEVALRKKENSILVVSGCLSQRYAKELKEEIEEIDIILGVGNYHEIDSILKNFSKKEKYKNTNASTFLIDNENRIITGSKIHAYIKISEGCNQKCSFCAIPQFKGKLKSRSISSCVSEIEKLIKNGYKDFSFIAQDSSSYMMDKGEKNALINLIDNVEQIEGIRSARILYLYPTSLSHSLIDKVANSKIFQNYFDIPLQHISDSMLKIMKRGATKARHLELLKHMREIDNSFIRTTILVGHPGEEESDFLELRDFISEFVFDRVNIFAYSKEENTPAFNMKNQVNKKITNKRIDSINEIITKQQEKIFKKYESTNLKAIVDGPSKESELLFSARDIRWDREIDGEILINENLDGKAIEAGYYEVKIDSYKDGYLIGKTIKRI